MADEATRPPPTVDCRRRDEGSATTTETAGATEAAWATPAGGRSTP